MKKIILTVFMLLEINLASSKENFLNFNEIEKEINEIDVLKDDPPGPSPQKDHDEISEAAESVYVLNGSILSNDTLDDVEITSTESDVSIVKATAGAQLTIGSNVTLRKTGGDSSDTESSEFYGVNAGILATKSSSITIESIDITTNAKGSNAVFATGENAKVTINGGYIYTYGGSSSRGLDATYSGVITANDLHIETEGGSCATLATDRGEGTVSCTNCNLTTKGIGSPIIYSTGAITLEDSIGNAVLSQLVVVEGKNSATIKNSVCTAVGSGNRGTTDSCGVMIYQSMSGDADTGKGYFTCENSQLTVVEGSSTYSTQPFFFITNTIAQIKTTGCTFEYGSDVLISLNGTSEWGKTGYNGGGATMYVYDQTIQGDIVADNISNLTMYLYNSTYIGTINKYKEAENITLIIDSDSVVNLTYDSYVTNLTNADTSGKNIVGKGKLHIIGDDDDDDDKTDKGLKGWAIALIVIGCIVIIAIVVILIFIFKKEKGGENQKSSGTEMQSSLKES